MSPATAPAGGCTKKTKMDKAREEFLASQAEKSGQGVKRLPVLDGCTSSLGPALAMLLGHSWGVEAMPRTRLTQGSGVASLQQESEDPVKNKVQRSRFSNKEAVPGNLPELIEVDALEAHVPRWRGSWWDLRGYAGSLHCCRSSRSGGKNRL
jgi:hypothetical protein